MRRSRLAVIIGLAAILALRPQPAAAHGIGQRYDLPVPLWLYLYGAASAVILSFVLIALFAGERGRGHGYPRLDLDRVRPVRAMLAWHPLALAVRAVSVALFLLLVASGLFGTQESGPNFAPTFFWVLWWVGLGFFVALVGNVWPLLNPWKTLFDLADAVARRAGLRGLERYRPYPSWLGLWPAVALYAAFVWMENVSAGGSEPRTLAIAVLAYSAVTWAGMAIYDRDVWLRHGEAFSVLYSVLGRFAPIELRVRDRSLCAECSAGCARWRECVGCEECTEDAPRGATALALRPWGAGLVAPPALEPGRIAFVLFLLASVTFDGLSATPAWVALFLRIRGALASADLTLALPVFQSLGLVVVPLLFLAAYRAAVALTGLERIARLAGAQGGTVALAFVHTLVPIAVAYQLAHYLTLLVGYGWVLAPLLSDPFGWGWDLFGTRSWSIEPILNAALVWYFQVGVIIAGHIIAVYLAHVVALRTVSDPRAAVRSQVPMLGLMVAYTVSSLWILSQGVVSESGVASLGVP